MGKRSKDIKSKERVIKYGEVLTPPHIVEAMIDLVKDTIEEISSKVLEPACGTGNFLVAILERKLKTVTEIYGNSKEKWKLYSLVALASLYGIELLPDNIQECRTRLHDLIEAKYREIFNENVDDDLSESIREILEANIICGNTLEMRTNENSPIAFWEWEIIDGKKLQKVRTHLLSDLVNNRGADK